MSAGMVRCPFCYRSFPAAEHTLKMRECPTCLRHFYPERADDEHTRCPKCRADWADYLAQGGVDPRAQAMKDEQVVDDVVEGLAPVGQAFEERPLEPEPEPEPAVLESAAPEPEPTPEPDFTPGGGDFGGGGASGDF